MPALVVDGLTFTFPHGWQISKYDNWSFYRNRFGRFLNGAKAVDLLAISPNRTTFLIEAKDYRFHRRLKTIKLADEIVKKVLDTLAAILPSKVNGDNQSEIDFSALALNSSKLRIVLHLEQPQKHSKLFPRAVDPADLQMKLRQQLKPIDAHLIVVEMNRMGSVPWTVG